MRTYFADATAGSLASPVKFQTPRTGDHKVAEAE